MTRQFDVVFAQPRISSRLVLAHQLARSSTGLVVPYHAISFLRDRSGRDPRLPRMMGGAASDPADLGSGMEWHGMAEQRLVARTTRPHTAEKGWLSTPPTSRLRGGWFLRWASDKPLNEAGGDEMPQMQIFSIGGPIVKPNLLFYSSRLAQSDDCQCPSPGPRPFWPSTPTQLKH
jgi:hypothetical protein